MPSFRQRPLTWQFWAATLCLDAAGAIRAPESAWFEGILAGQLLIASAWAVLGRGHRLAGGAAWITAVLGVTALASFGDRVADEWRYILGSALLMTAATLTLSLLCRAVLEQFTYALPKSRFQFSVIELLGWTIIVALAATAFRQAIGVHLFEASYLIPIVAMAATVSLAAVMFLSPARPRLCIALLLTLAATGASYIGGRLDWFHWLGGVRSDVITLGYVAMWILAMRLDESVLAADATSEPQSANHPPE